MAGNPMWCLSLDEWKGKFAGWIRDPLPAALLNASIFFDFRALWGEEALARDLRAWLSTEVRDNQRFLRAMAQGALESQHRWVFSLISSPRMPRVRLTPLI